MAILHLPASTINLLGSAQALTTPTSLVKELVDNSIDAKATSVDVFISPNTLDKIEVRDNGQGIPQVDLDALGRRGYTSKLKSFEELRSIGGISLGFRGEALASAVQLGQVSVTTRTDGEAVATTVKLKVPGGIESQVRSSHPIGTTVSVSNFMFKLPVRKQSALKEAPKTLAKIKGLLQAYALARPRVRFSLKVTKGGKDSWSFAPRPNDGIREAVSKAIGRDIASQCIEKSLTFPENGHQENRASESAVESEHNVSNEPKDGRYVIDVFLPRPDADSSKVGYGPHISIDSRPVSHEKGAIKKIVNLFKLYIRNSHLDSPRTLKNPFIRLNIQCPAASYDPNIEPAKDDVIFENESLILALVERLFKDVYGEYLPERSISARQLPSTYSDNFDLLLPRGSTVLPVSNSSPTMSEDLVPATIQQTSTSKTPQTSPETRDTQSARVTRRWGHDMSKDYSEGSAGLSPKQNQSLPETQSTCLDMSADPAYPLNPWVISKMTAPVGLVRSNCTVSADRAAREPHPPSYILPTLQRSSDPIPCNTGASPILSSPQQQFLTHDITPLFVENLSDQPSSVVNTTIGGQQPNGQPFATSSDEELLFVSDNGRISTPKNDFVSSRNLANIPLISPPATSYSQPHRTSWDQHRPFISPIRLVGTAVSKDGLHQTRLPTMTQALQNQNIHHQDAFIQQDKDADVASAMDYENRKEQATRRRREELRVAELKGDGVLYKETRSSPHKTRYESAVAALGAHQIPQNDLLKTSLPDDDPQAYLMRRSQKGRTGEQSRLVRVKSMKMPLEQIPENERTHNLLQTIPVKISTLRRFTVDLVKTDQYMRYGNQARGILLSKSEARLVGDRLEMVVKKWVQCSAQADIDVEYDLQNLQTSDQL